MTENLTTNEVVDLLKGPRGTEVAISVQRENASENLTFKVVRDAIERKVKIERLEEVFGKIVIPVERVTTVKKVRETKNGEKITKWIHKLRVDGVAVDGDTLTVGETLFTICPWWDGPNTQREVAEQLARDAAKDKKQWIWVYHAPPKASPTSWTGDRDVGDAELVRWIGEYGPHIVLAGHIHESPFARGGSWVDRIGSTWVFNSGRQIGPSPAHIIFDTNRQVALWFSLAGAETVRLDQPLQRPLEELTALPDWLR